MSVSAQKRGLTNLLYSAWDLFWIHLDRIISTVRSHLSLRFQGCAPPAGLSTTGSCHFKARHAGSIVMGKNATLLAGWRSNRVGMNGPVLITTLADGRVDIGDHFGASSVVISSRAGITIGNYVNLGGNVRIFDHDFHSLEPELRRSPEDQNNIRSKPVFIGNDVFIGTNAIILKGVSLGDCCIVGAGAVVTKSFPANSVIAGNPATEIHKSNRSIDS